MVTLVNRAKVSSTTTGTGTITLGSAESGYQTFANAGVVDANVVRYVIEDGTAWEIGSGTYTATGTTLSRTLDESSTGALLNLTGAAVVYVSATAADFLPPAVNVSLDDTSFVVAVATDMQGFAEKTDSALLRARGTGVSTTYVSTVDVGGTTFAQPAVSGEINSDQGYFEINYAGAAGITVSNLSAISAYVYIDNTGALQQQSTTPTRQDWSRKLFTMRIGIDTVAETIIGFEYFSNPLGHYPNSMRDLYTFLVAQGVPFKKDQTITGRAGDLGFDVSSGSLLEFGGTGDINNANIKDFDAVANASYNLLSRTTLVSSETNLVKFWDNAGTITALGSTTVVGHRLYRFSNGNFAMQYGQGNYANITLAKAGALLEDFDLNPNLLDATFFGWWFIQETATNTGGTTLTDFVEYTIGVQGGSSSSLSGALLKGNNLSDLLNPVSSRANLGVEIGVDVQGLLIAGTNITIAGDGTIAASGGGGTALELYAENPVTPTAPSVSGANAFAIGDNAETTQDDAIALGDGSSARGAASLSMGRNSYTNSTYAVALGPFSDGRAFGAAGLGYNSQSHGSQSTALTNSYASGTDSFAAAIANNTSSYGATGANSIAMGQLAKATGANSAAIGKGATANGQHSFSIGQNAVSGTTGGNNYAVAIGEGATGTGAFSTSIGGFTDATAQHSLALGSYAQAIGVSSVSLGNSYASGADSFAAAIANNTATYGATGANSIAMGQLAKSTSQDSVAIGRDTIASNFYTVALGYQAVASGSQAFASPRATASGSQSVCLGVLSTAAGGSSILIGPQASTSVTAIGGVALGRYATSDGPAAVAIGQSYASGTDSFAAVITNNTSSYGATGANSVAIGDLAKATDSDSICLANSSTASGSGSAVLGGRSNTASSSGAVAMGGSSNTASGTRSFAYGYYGNTDGITNKVAHGIGPSRQNGMYGLAIDTTDATPASLATDYFSAGALTQVILPNNSAYAFSGTIIARQDAASGSNYASWEIKGALLRDANAASTVLGNGIVNKLFATAGAAAWDIELTADTTNGGLKITATGAAAVNIRWVATVNTSEVTF
jgi:hypothetical protein